MSGVSSSVPAAAPLQPAVTVDGLTKMWTFTSGLRPVTFSVSPGELLVVRGRSGSGKSTLLALLAGWCTADAGTIAFADGRDSVNWGTVAIVPQTLALVPELTVRENIAEALHTSGWSRAERADRVQHSLDLLDLADLADRPPADTSMGQQQRAAVARCVAARPAVILADEPTSHQDAQHALTVIAALQASAAAGSALVVASHAGEVVAAADQVIDLDV